jgi:hypothetical protein
MENKRLFTKKGEAFLQKTDIFKRMMWFSYRHESDVFIPMKVDKVKEVLEMNSKNEQPEDLVSAMVQAAKAKVVEHSFENVVGQDSLTRFDKSKQKNRPQQNKQNRPLGQQNKSKGPQGQNQNKPLNQNKSVNPQNKGTQNPNQNKGTQNPNKGPNTQNKGTNNPNQKNFQNKPRNQNPNQNPNQKPQNNPNKK